MMDLAVSFVSDGGMGVNGIYEAFADLTLMFGFLPVSNITIIGVGWTLGVIFGFYILFPFFVYLIWTKKRAWFSLIITVALNYVCNVYFLHNGSAVQCNVLRWLCYFIAGGLIYLYKDDLRRFMKNKVIGIAVTVIGFTLVFMVKNPFTGNLGTLMFTLMLMVGFSLMVIGALCPDTKLWSNPVSKFISKISLEIYLAHMMIFRVIEKLGLTKIAGEGILSYLLTCVGTIVGVLIFAALYQYIEGIIKKKYLKERSSL